MLLFTGLGALDSICVQLAKNSEDWKAWYDSPTPELLDLPLSASEGDLLIDVFMLSWIQCRQGSSISIYPNFRRRK